MSSNKRVTLRGLAEKLRAYDPRSRAERPMADLLDSLSRSGYRLVRVVKPEEVEAGCLCLTYDCVNEQHHIAMFTGGGIALAYSTPGAATDMILDDGKVLLMDELEWAIPIGELTGGEDEATYGEKATGEDPNA